MNKSKFSRYNDGVVMIYREIPHETDFNAKENVSYLDDLEFIVKLDYEESSRREQDNSFAEQMDFSLSLKVRTRYIAAVDNKCKAIINDYLYDSWFLIRHNIDCSRFGGTSSPTICNLRSICNIS